MKAFWSGVLALAGAVALHAAGSGDQVVIVYNKKVPESKGVAEYYAQRRQVPAGQVFGLDLSTGEDMSRAEFRDSLQKPLAKALEAKKLWRVAPRMVPGNNRQPAREEQCVVESKIRYAVLCYGVPLRILPDPNLQGAGTENLRPEARRNEAAVDNELALLPATERNLPLTGPLRNPVYAVTNAALLHPTNGVLIVNRLDGPTADIARGLVDKALEAEANDGLWGRAYFDLRNTTEPAYKVGDDWIRTAAEAARHLGYETVVDENPGTFPASFPLSQIAFYAGWYTENVSGPFAEPKVEFMPGAFGYHLHSFSAGSLRSTNRFWTGPLLAKGVTATMGCVNEPYLTGTPDMAVFTTRWMFFGFTFGEAAYAGQSFLSWQTTVVGDPLYRPFGQSPPQVHAELEKRHSPWLEWSYLRLLNLNAVNGRPAADCVIVLEQMELTKHSPVLSEKLGDLYAAQGKPSSAVYAYNQALNCKPSPQQRIRLLLALGEKLPALDRESEAYDAYRKLAQECPEYPDKLAIYRKLVPLAQKLGKKADAEQYEAEITRLAMPLSKP